MEDEEGDDFGDNIIQSVHNVSAAVVSRAADNKEERSSVNPMVLPRMPMKGLWTQGCRLLPVAPSVTMVICWDHFLCSYAMWHQLLCLQRNWVVWLLIGFCVGPVQVRERKHTETSIYSVSPGAAEFGFQRVHLRWITGVLLWKKQHKTNTVTVWHLKILPLDPSPWN